MAQKFFSGKVAAQQLSTTPNENSQLSNICSAVKLNDVSLDTLRCLSRLTSEFRQSTSNVRRIQTGSPGAGELERTVRTFQTRFSSITSECQQVIAKHPQFPGIDLLQRRLTELQRTLSEQFNDGGNKDGFSERVRVLEKLNYTNGMLRGAVEMIIEHHEYWKNQLAGQEHQPLARHLNFNVTETTATSHVTISPFAGSFVLILLIVLIVLITTIYYLTLFSLSSLLSFMDGPLYTVKTIDNV